jgi:hypothetical protein
VTGSADVSTTPQAQGFVGTPTPTQQQQLQQLQQLQQHQLQQQQLLQQHGKAITGHDSPVVGPQMSPVQRDPSREPGSAPQTQIHATVHGMQQLWREGMSAGAAPTDGDATGAWMAAAGGAS